MNGWLVFGHERDGPQGEVPAKYLYFSFEELQIADLSSEGKSEEQIAEILKIDQQQLCDIRRRIKDKALMKLREDK